MAQIQIYSDTNKGCIFFDGSTVEPKFIGTIVANVKPDEDRIVVKRTDRLESDGVTFRTLFKRLNPSRVQNELGENLVTDLGYTTAQVIEYINGEANDFQTTSAVQLTLDDTPNFTLDATSTTILIDNGDKHAVNSIKAILGEDGLIDIVSHGDGDIVYYEDIEPSNVNINDASVSGGPSDIVNTLNELFTMGAFESVVIADPYSTMVADVAGVVDGGAVVGSNAIDPAGTDILAASSSHYNRTGWVSEESIDQAGEYFTFDIRVTDSMGFGLILDQGADKYGAGSYADPAMFCNDSTSNSANWGYYWSHWFHSGNKGPWTYYGQRTSSSIREGWGAFSSSDERVDYIADAPVKMKVGIDANGYMEVSWYDVSESTWRQVQRSSYVIEEGESLKLGIKVYGTRGRLHTVPKKHLLEPAAPTMQFRYIESPDGEFHYPLFATAEEANYYDEITNGLAAGTGSSHTHTYVDDPTGTTWYMPEASHDASTYTHTSAPTATTFSGNPVTYTEVTSQTNADLTPTAFSGSDITQEEGTNVNIQVTPQGASWSTSVSISPTTSGLVYDGYSLIQGTLADVNANTVYTITVTRANSYGSSVGTMTVTATDVAPVQTNDTPWTKALDFSGSNEHAKMVTTSTAVNALRMSGLSSAAGNNADSNKTSNSSNALPWATAIVFKIDGNNSNQHIWNSGEGSGNSDDNIYLRLTSNRSLFLGWGRGSDNNECRIATNLNTSHWYGIYVASKGARFNSSGATNVNLALAFDIRMATSEYSFPSVTSNLSTEDNWGVYGTTGHSMQKATTGDFTIGGRGSNRNFHGKVASMVVTTLMKNADIPTDAEILTMITDPVKWVTDYKIAQTYRYAANDGTNTFAIGQAASYYATQVWLMGDGANDSYSNMIRNYIYTADQNATKLQLNSMVSNDIETVNINGLT